MQSNALRILGGVLAALVIITFLLMSFRIISFKSFWMSMIFYAIIAWFGIPQLRKKLDGK